MVGCAASPDMTLTRSKVKVTWWWLSASFWDFFNELCYLYWHLPIASLVKSNFAYSCASVDRISAEVDCCSVSWASCKYGAILRSKIVLVAENVYPPLHVHQYSTVWLQLDQDSVNWLKCRFELTWYKVTWIQLDLYPAYRPHLALTCCIEWSIVKC